MPLIPHAALPKQATERITTRVIVSEQAGAESTEIWQQWMKGDNYIPLHYHEVEEVLMITRGRVKVTLGEKRCEAVAPVTILIPAGQLHALKPAGSEPVELLAFFPVTNPKAFTPEGQLSVLPWQESK